MNDNDDDTISLMSLDSNIVDMLNEEPEDFYEKREKRPTRKKPEPIKYPVDEEGLPVYMENPNRKYNSSYEVRAANHRYMQRMKRDQPERYRKIMEKKHMQRTEYNTKKLLNNNKIQTNMKIFDIKIKEKEDYIEALENELRNLELKNNELNKLVSKFKKFL